MSYNPSIPQPTDLLSVSQPQLLINFNTSNSSFGIDHYPFADLTSNNGKHNQVTNPAYVANPPTGQPPVTIANEPRIYGFQDSVNLGVIQYSRDFRYGAPAVPSPLTKVQSSSTPIVLAPSPGPGNTTPILDFAGLSRAMGIVTAFDATNPYGSPRGFGFFYVYWNGAVLGLQNVAVGTASVITVSLLQGSIAGSILSLANVSGLTLNNVFWTMELQRTS